MKRISIRTKLTFLISLTIIVVAVILSGYFFMRSSMLLHDELKKRGASIAHNLAYTSKEGILTKNLFEELKPLVEAVMTEPDVVCVAIIDETGNVLAHSNPKEVGKVYVDEFTKKTLSAKEVLYSKETKEIITFGAGVKVDEKEKTILEKAEELEIKKEGPIGAVIVKISLKNLHLRMNDIFKINLEILLGLLIIGIIFAFLFSTQMTNPIRSLVEVSHAISSGELEKRAAVETNDEIGELSISFNEMTENLIKAMYELEIEKQSLKQRIYERTQELEEANIKLKTRAGELEAVNKELESFTYSASHDLKEPLRGIEAFSQFLLEDYTDKLDDTGKDYLKRLAASAVRMKSLIDDLLALSRISRIKNPYTSVDTGKLVKEVIKQLRPIIEEKNIRIEVDDELPFIFCDEVKIKQVFYNLILNAIKYNDKKCPEIEIGIEKKMVEGISQGVFFVKDNGIGIEEKYFEEIFGIFKRLHRGNEYGGGTGAGLAIVKRVITDHGGNVWVKSTPDEGSTFYFSLSGKGEK